jgi:hypothetical protein
MRQTPTHSGLIEVLLFATLFTATTLAGSLLAAPAPVAAQTTPAIPTTQLTDTVYRADGTTATGTVLISWPAFTTATGLSVPAGNTSVTIAAGGVFTVALAPNAGSNPMGSYYTAIYHLDDGTVSREYWVVPVSTGPVAIASIKSTVLPATVALQTVTKSYVDTSIANVTTAYVPIAGGTMTGPLVLPGDPVSSLQAADKHYVDTSVAAVGGGSGGKVALAPSASQAVAQPAGTALSVNRLNGVEYASQYTTGGAANGIANAAASTDCAAGCEITADSSYAATEALRPTQWNSQTHVEDTRKGGRWDSYLNPENVQTPGIETGQTIDTVSTRSGAALHQLTGTDTPASVGLAVSNEAPAGGSNLFPQSIGANAPYFKSAYSALTVNGTYNTQGQHVLAPHGVNCYGVGDCLIGSEFLTSAGGFRDEADEGTHPKDIQISEDTHVFDGTCATGCTTGSTALAITPTSGAGTQGDGRFLIDMNPARVLSTGTLIGGSLAAPHATASFTGTSFPLTTFFSTGQVIPSQATDIAPGTVTFVIATAGVPSGYATSTSAAPATTGLACIADQVSGTLPSNYEMAAYTVIDATHLQIAFKKPHATLATVAIGGLCGYGLEQKVDTTGGIRQVFPVVGSYSATALYYAGTSAAIVGQQGTTSGFVNVNAPIATASRSGNLVTLTASSALPFDLNGLTVTISGVADSSYNGTFPVTTTSPTTLTYTQTGANSSSTGGSITLQTGSFALYPMAEVLSVYNASTRAVDGFMTLAPNNVAWAVGDAVEEPHFFQQIVAADISFVTQTTPRPTTYARAGITYQGNNGPGLQGWSIDNSTPASSYIGNGGTHLAPDFAYQALGVWKRSMVLQAGEQSAFTLNCNSHGCGRWNSNYNLFELQSSAGADTIQFQPPSSTLTFSLRGTPFTFSPSGLTAGTLNATTLNATTLNGALAASNIASGTVAAARLPLFGPSGSAHAAGIVPDPGAAAGTTHFLREDGTWAVPAGGSGGGGSSSVAAITSGTIDGATIGATTPSTGAFTTLSASSLTVSTPIAVASGGTGSATTPAAGQILIGNSGGTAFGPQTVSGDCTLSASGATTCTKTNGVAFGTAATTAASAYDAAGAATAAAAAATTSTALLTTLRTLTNCNTSGGYYLSPFSGTCVAVSGGGGGSVSSVTAGTWPSWLTPTITNSTSTPTIAVTASAIPNSALANASVNVNGTACALGSSCTTNSFATLPAQSSVLADYQLTDGSGTAPADSSGNGNTGTFPGGTANPAWTTQGLSFTGGYPATATGQYFCTAGTTSAQTVMIAYTSTAPLGNNGPSYPTYYTLFANAAISGLGFYAPSQNYGFFPGMNLNGAPLTAMNNTMVGTHVLVIVYGTGSGGTPYDTYYLDGVQQSLAGTNYSSGKSTGVYCVGGANTGYSTYLYGQVYRATFWSTQLTPQQAAAASQLTTILAQQRGVNFAPQSIGGSTPQAVFTGDSLTNGNGVTPFTASLSTRIAYNVNNFGIGNIGANVNASLMPYREQYFYSPLAQSNVAFIWNGTNDVVTKGFTAQAALNSILTECNYQRRFGYKTIVATPISRATGGTSNDPADKDALGPLIRQYAVSGGCDVVADFAGDPRVGADGAYSNTTYYQGDTTHLTAAGQASVIAPMASHAIDQATGSTLANCDPNVVTASTYTSVASDGCKVFNTAANSITDTLPSAVGYTGRIIRRCNNSLSGSNTLTLAAPSDTPFNNVAGTTTITVPNNTCKDFKSTLISVAAAGEYWQQLN